jgi:hypothetical protein
VIELGRESGEIVSQARRRKLVITPTRVDGLDREVGPGGIEGAGAAERA